MKLICFRWLAAGCWFVLSALSVIPSVHAETETPKAEGIKINGDAVEYFYKENKAVGKGNIRIQYAGSTLLADEVEVNLKSKIAEARGHVTFIQDEKVLQGDAVYVDYSDKTIKLENVKLKVAPHYFAKGEHVERISGGHYDIQKGYVTTCDGPMCEDDWVPPYRIKAREVLYYPDDRVVMKHAVFMIYDVPFFYIPLIVIPELEIDRFPIEVQAGRKKEWGAFALTRYRYYLNPNARGSLMMDVREKQGLAGGIEHFYNTQTLGEGAFRYYYADDKCGATDIECSRSQSHVSPESSRYRVGLRHRWQMTPDTGMNFELNKLSDEFVIQDFFNRDEYERIVFPDNYISIITAKEDYTLSTLARYRIDDFVGVVERTPEFRFDTHTHAVGGSQFYIRHEAQAARLNRAFKDEDERHNEANRANLRHTVSYVMKAEPWTITPFVASRETYYSRDIAGDDTDFVRHNVEAGFDMSTKFFKIYETHLQGYGLDINRLRHIFTPNIRYRYASRPTHARESLYDFDSVDNLDHENFFRFELENKFQTKHTQQKDRTGTRTLVRSIVFADVMTPAFNRMDLERVGLDVELFPSDPITIDFETEYDLEGNEFSYANADVILKFDPTRISIGDRYINGGSHQLTAQFDWKINDRFSTRLYERFEFSESLTDEFEANLQIRDVLCWTMNLTYNYRNGGSFFVSFAPTGFPETAFQSNQYYRPHAYETGPNDYIPTPYK